VGSRRKILGLALALAALLASAGLATGVAGAVDPVVNGPAPSITTTASCLAVETLIEPNLPGSVASLYHPPCLDAGKTVLSTALTPNLDLSLTTPSQTKLGDDALNYSLKLKNTGATLELSGKFAASNYSKKVETLASYFDFIEYYSPEQSKWVPLAGKANTKAGYSPTVTAPITTGISLQATPQSSSGVSYPTSGDPIIGTVVNSSSTAIWNYTASVDLTPNQIALLLDPTRAKKLRNMVHFESTAPKTGGGEVSALRTTATYFTKQLQTQSGDARQASITVNRKTGGSVTFDSTTTPALARVRPDESATVDVSDTTPKIATKGQSESDSAYLARLQSIDGESFNVGVSTQATANGKAKEVPKNDDILGIDTDPNDYDIDVDPSTQEVVVTEGEYQVSTDPDRNLNSSSSKTVGTRKLPVVSIDKTGPAQATVSTNVTYSLSVANGGSASAQTIKLTDKVNGQHSKDVTDGPATLAPSASGTGHATHRANDFENSGSLSDTGSVTWEDANGSSYGPLSDHFTTELVRSTPPAGALDTTRSTSLGEATQFLYSGSNPTQQGVAAGTIDEKRAAVIRGQVTDRSGAALAGVKVSVLGHPEFGWTNSLADGSVYLAVNGGGPLTLQFEKTGYLRAQRTVDAAWQQYAFFDDVALVSTSGAPTTTINVGVGSLPQTARGSQESDSDGSRRATVYFPPSTSAQLEFANGTTQSVSQLTLQPIEATVGTNGPEAMPGDLPATSSYTYASAFSVQEVEQAGAQGVRFSQPVVSYTENFLGFAVGETVPSGYYDQQKGAWIAGNSGRVVKVLSESGGLAALDVTGSGQAADSATLAGLGITDTERGQIATLYDPGQTLWRVPLDHFSWWDFNWAAMYPPDDDLYQQRKRPGDQDKPCHADGSDIECENQVLGERIPVTGTPLGLNYRSNRVPGRKSAYRLKIPLTGTDGIAATAIQVDIEVAGRRFSERVAATPNAEYTFDWDGKDAFDRTLQGPQRANVRVSYVYEEPYARTSRFGEATGTALATNAREETLVWRDYKEVVGAWDARSEGLGGWTLDVHHTYDPASKTLYYGDGRVRSNANSALNGMIDTAAGTGGSEYNGDGGPATQANLWDPRGIDVGPDGSLYIAELQNCRIRKVDPQGTITTIAGNGQRGFSGDGGQATAAKLNNPGSVALGPDGSVYFSDYGNGRIRKIAPNGVITTVAGGGSSGQDGIPATEASIGAYGLDVATDGSLYITTGWNYGLLRKVDPGGIITTIAGCPSNPCPDNGRGLQTFLYEPRYPTVAPDGSIYFTSGSWAGNTSTVWRLLPDGTIKTIAGATQVRGFSGDGGPASEAKIDTNGLAVGPDGALYLTQGPDHRVRRIGPDGIIDTVVGKGFSSDNNVGDRGSPLDAIILHPTNVAFGPGGSMYISSTNRVRRVSAVLPGFSGGEIAIPSEDGAELYRFDKNGRHLKTVKTLTGQTTYSFAYDDSGHVAGIQDGDGNVTEIQHDTSGNPATIVGPFGQTTTLAVNGDGYLSSVTNPESEATHLSYASGGGGLLTTFTDAKNQDTTFTYDTLGRLTRDTDRAGGYQALDRTEGSANSEVTKTTRLGRTTRYKLQRLSSVEQKRTITKPSGTQSVTVARQNGSRTLTSADGTVAQMTEGGDPRFGLDVPFDKTSTVTTPGGLSLQTQASKGASLSNADDPLSLTSFTNTSIVNGRTSSSVYNASTRRFTNTSPAGRISTGDIDSQGRPVRTEVSGITPTTFTYDVFGRISTSQQGTRTWQYAYNSDGYVGTITDPLGRQTSFTYDGAGRVTNEALPGGRNVAYSYDHNGNLTSIIPPGRSAHSFSSTPLDLTGSYTPPSVGDSAVATQYTYDYDHNVSLVTRPDGSEIDLDYDSAGRLASADHPGGTISYSYDSSDRLSSVSAPGGQGLDFSYDGPLAKQETFSGPVSGNVSRTYDSSLRVTEDKVNGANAISYSYDQDDLLTAAGAMTLTRNAQNGRLTATSLASTASSVAYNAFGERASESSSYSGSPLLSATYTRDAGGRIAQKTETSSSGMHSYVYTYDDAGRLTDVTMDGGALSHYTYDQNGNRLAKTSGGVTVSASYDAQDRLTAYGGATYTYTRNGDLRTKTEAGSEDTTTYDYDALGALTKVTLPNGTEIDYVVDGQGRRVGRKVDDTLSHVLLFGQRPGPEAELDASGNVRSRFVYATRSHVPDYMTKAGSTYRIVTDQLGSPRLVVNTSTGGVVQQIEYDEFGNVLSDSNPGFQPFGFAGGLYDPDTGLVRFGARDYDPETGRWTAKDPILFAGGDTNLYGYVVSDPINFSDVTGLWPSLGDAWERAKDAARGIGNGAKAVYNYASDHWQEAGAIAGGAACVVGTAGVCAGVLGGTLALNGLYNLDRALVTGCWTDAARDTGIDAATTAVSVIPGARAAMPGVAKILPKSPIARGAVRAYFQTPGTAIGVLFP
jgi:RHS repeat-associated protein